MEYNNSYQAHGETVNIKVIFDNEPSRDALKNYAKVAKEIIMRDKKEEA